MVTKEVKDIAISAFALAAGFGIVLSGGLGALLNPTILLSNFLLALVTVSIAFIFHELAHRYVSRRYGCYAEYKMWPQGLMLLIITSFLGFLFAAPGAVVIHQRRDLWGNAVLLTKKSYGIISLAGPLTNLILAGIFFSGSLFASSVIFSYGIMINVWLALFNLIPFPPLDGSKIFAWSKMVWASFLIITAAMFIIL